MRLPEVIEVKSLEETKTALECCFQYRSCIGCPYLYPDKPRAECIPQMGIDALLHMCRLEALAKKSGTEERKEVCNMSLTMNEYQQLAQRTSNTNTYASKIENGLLGLFGEGGECADLYKKYMYQEHEFDKERMAKELGDVLWYVAEIATGLKMTLEDIAQMNIDKLKARYPDGFEGERSKHRMEGDV